MASEYKCLDFNYDWINDNLNTKNVYMMDFEELRNTILEIQLLLKENPYRCACDNDCACDTHSICSGHCNCNTEDICSCDTVSICNCENNCNCDSECACVGYS